MDRARSAVQYMAVISLAAACVYAIYGVLYPPFSDSEIKASIVDTWQAHALFTFAMFVAIAVIAMASLAFRFGSVDRVVRRLNIVALALSIACIALLLYSHVALTERTTQITGQTF